MNRSAGGKAEKRALRLYLRLLMSYSDFKHAYRGTQRLIAEYDSGAYKSGDDFLLRAIYSSIVVSYSRPFNSAGTSRVGRIPALDKELLPIYSTEEVEVHEYVLYCRNKLIAHTDAEVVDPEAFVATDMPRDMVIPQTNDALAPFTREYTLKVRDMSEKAYHWSVEERMRLEPRVIHLLERRAWVRQEANGAAGT